MESDPMRVLFGTPLNAIGTHLSLTAHRLAFDLLVFFVDPPGQMTHADVVEMRGIRIAKVRVGG